MISYSYLWKREARSGQDEGLKDRPCAIVVAQQVEDDRRTRVLVAPISHQPPNDPAMDMELPAQLEQILKLDWAPDPCERKLPQVPCAAVLTG